MSIADLSEIKLDESNVVSADESLANLLNHNYGNQFSSINVKSDKTD